MWLNPRDTPNPYPSRSNTFERGGLRRDPSIPRSSHERANDHDSARIPDKSPDAASVPPAEPKSVNFENVPSPVPSSKSTTTTEHLRPRLLVPQNQLVIQQLFSACERSLHQFSLSSSTRSKFRDHALQLRLWGADLFSEPTSLDKVFASDIPSYRDQPPSLRNFIVGVLADIAVTLTYLVSESSRLFPTEDDYGRNALVIILGDDQVAPEALNEPEYLEIGCHQGRSFTDFADQCGADISAAMDTLFALLPSLARMRAVTLSQVTEKGSTDAKE